MMLRVELAVKFRAFGITFGTLHKEWKWPVPFLCMELSEKPTIHMNERGVKLDLWLDR